MKTKTIILYIVIAAIVYAMIYYGYRNYKASGNIFKYTVDTNTDVVEYQLPDYDGNLNDVVGNIQF